MYVYIVRRPDTCHESLQRHDLVSGETATPISHGTYRRIFFFIRNNTVAQRYRSYARYQNKDQAAALASTHPN